MSGSDPRPPDVRWRSLRPIDAIAIMERRARRSSRLRQTRICHIGHWGRAELSTRTRLIVAANMILLTARQDIPRLTAQAYALGLFHVTC